MAILSREIKEKVRSNYIEPARRSGQRTVTIVAGDVIRALHLVNRAPTVCAALSSKGFLEENRLLLEKREGPPSGLSTTVKFTYRLLDKPEPGQSAPSAFLGLRGAAKQVFEDLGGGETFIRKERAQFYGSDREPARRD